MRPERQAVHLTKRTASGGFVRGHRHVHVGPLTPADVTVVDGMTVTTLERTTVDIAMGGDCARALVAFDRALSKNAERSALGDILGRRSGHPGVTVARQALSYADGASESVGEPWSRAQMIAAGLPLPRLQHTFRTPIGEFRSDFDWDGVLIGEFDGLHKYGLRPGETARDALIREKMREDALRAMGVIVVRWTWADLERGEVVGTVRHWLEKLGYLAA